VLPAHLAADSPALYSGEENGKAADFRWMNLQLPLYAMAIQQRDGTAPAPCYFTLGATEADVDIREWAGFTDSDLDAARSCAEWLVGQITAGVFWPPAEQVDYDDFANLAAGRPLEEMFQAPA
jgi:hypothetical protein